MLSEKDYENLITVDVVCRAVPSPLIFRKYVEFQEQKLADKIKQFVSATSITDTNIQR